MNPQACRSNWKVQSLGQSVEILDSRRVPVNSEERKKRVGTIPYYGATGQVGWIDDHLFDEELVLLGEDGAPFLNSSKPKAYLVRGKSWVNNHAHVLRAKPGLLSSFLLYQLNCADYRPYVSGTTRLKLPQGPMRQIPLFIPAEEEQREIVAEIEKQFTRLEAGVAGLRRVQANLKRYRAAVLKAACEGKLVPTEACLRQAERGRQAELARQEGRTLPAPRPGVFFIYAIRCDNDSIYIGQTQDLQKRWQEHLAGQAADWTSQHKPVLIVHYEEYPSREEAVAREKWLKTGFGRKWLRREIAAGRLPAEQVGARQAGYETGAQLLERILTERRKKWNGKGKYKEPVKPDTETLSELPQGWAWASLEQIGQADRPIIYGIIKPGPHISNGVPYVRVTEMKDGRIDVPNLRRTSQERAAKFARATLAPGDVLISKDGTIGRVAVVPPELAGGNITQHVMRAPINAAMFRNYLVWAIRSDSCQRWLTGETRGVALRGVNVEDFRRLPVPVPPVPEQQRIVAEVERRLSVVEELEAVVNANRQRANRLRQSILQRAFKGNLHNVGRQVVATSTICADDLRTDKNVG